jgi:hypothetical protein
MAVGGAAGGQNPFKFNGCDHIGESGILEIVQPGRVKGFEPGRHDDGTHIQGQDFFLVLIINGPGWTDLGAGAAFVLQEFQADGRVNGIFQGDGLGIRHIDGLSLVQTLIIFIIGFARAFLGAFPTGNAFVHVHVPRCFFNGDGKITRLTLDLLDGGKGVKLYVQVPADLDQFG